MAGPRAALAVVFCQCAWLHVHKAYREKGNLVAERKPDQESGRLSIRMSGRIAKTFTRTHEFSSPKRHLLKT